MVAVSRHVRFCRLAEVAVGQADGGQGREIEGGSQKSFNSKRVTTEAPNYTIWAAFKDLSKIVINSQYYNASVKV